jgi:hypothetical protein
MVAAALVLWTATSAAEDQRDIVVLTTDKPYWEVGIADAALSTECARGRFNQRDLYRLKIHFNGNIGPGTVGIATSDFNLVDPNRRAQPETTYFFYRDKTSDCQVFRFTAADQKRKLGAVPLDLSPYRQAIEKAYSGWTLEEMERRAASSPGAPTAPPPLPAGRPVRP